MTSSHGQAALDPDDDKKRPSIPKYSVVFVISFHLAVYFGFRGLSGRYPTPTSAREAELRPTKFSEELARRHLLRLTSLGHRPTGSEANEVHAVRYIVDEIKKIRDGAHPVHSIDVDLQEVSGTFDLGFLNHFVQYYENVKNILVRFEPANSGRNVTDYILVNCHFDTVCQSPGASDDAASCCIMIETLRALSSVDEPFRHGVVFNFNGAEENILQASHGFITEHPWAKNVKAFVNLEGAGGGGWELLFQSGPQHPWLLRAYASSAPHPFAHAVAQDIFQSGIVPSDTDFRIYRDFGQIPGLDIAYMSNGYIYHTKWDDVAQIPAGCLQRGGENILGLLTNLLNSPFISDPGQYKFGKVVFFDLVGLFMISYGEQASLILNVGFGVVVLAAVWLKILGGHRRFGGRRGGESSSRASLASGGVVDVDDHDEDYYSAPVGREYLTLLFQHLGIFLLSSLAALAAPLVVGALLSGCIFPVDSFVGRFFFRPMSWYATPANAVGLFLLPSGAAALFVASLFTFSEKSASKMRNRWHLAEISSDALQSVYAVVLLLLTWFKILSSYLFLLLTAFPLCCRYLLRLSPRRFYRHPYRCLSIKCLAFSPLTLYMTQLVGLVFEFFIPIMGRVGAAAPPDLVIAGMTGLGVVLASSLWIGVVFVVDRRRHRLLIGVLTVTFLAHFSAILFTPLGFAYDMSLPHPKPQRSLLHHVNFIGYDADGKPSADRSSSRLWFVPFDFFGKRALEPFVPELRDDGPDVVSPPRHLPAGRSPLKAFDEKLAPFGTSRPFWNMPYFFPIQSILKESYLLPEVAPFSPATRISLQLVSKAELHPGYTRVVVAIDPHDHTSVMLSPRPGYVLGNWSVGDGMPKPSHYIPKNEGEEGGQTYGRWGYFIFYGFGRKPSSKWTLTFDVMRLDSDVNGGATSEGRPIVDVSVNPHFLHGEKRITAEMKRFLNRLPEWSYCLPWSAEQHLWTI